MPGDPPRRKWQAFASRAALAAVALISGLPTAAQGPLLDHDVVDKIPPLLALYSEQGDLRLPNLSPAELDALAAGTALVTLYHEEKTSAGDVHAMRVVGWQVVKAPRLLVWLSLFGGNEDSSARLQHVVLTRRPAGAYVSYHHVDLPWPFSDRHWLILCEQNSSLANASHDEIWEHRWSLLPPDGSLLEATYESGRVVGLTRKAFDNSVYLTANRGAWIVFDLGEAGTLVAASMDVDFGGHFPDALVQSYAKQQMKAFFAALHALPGAHYAAKPVIDDGRGVPITREAALRAARHWGEKSPLVVASATNENP